MHGETSSILNWCVQLAFLHNVAAGSSAAASLDPEKQGRKAAKTLAMLMTRGTETCEALLGTAADDLEFFDVRNCLKYFLKMTVQHFKK